MDVWTDQGLLVFEDNTTPFYMGRIDRISEKFRIAAGQDALR